MLTSWPARITCITWQGCLYSTTTSLMNVGKACLPFDSFRLQSSLQSSLEAPDSRSGLQQVSQQSPISYLQKSAGQPTPQLPSPQSIKQQHLHPKTGHTVPDSNGNNGSSEAKDGASGRTAPQLPLLRPAPPILQPFAGMLYLLVAQHVSALKSALPATMLVVRSAC